MDGPVLSNAPPSNSLQANSNTPTMSSAKSVADYRSRFGPKPMLKTEMNLRSVTAKQLLDATQQRRQSGHYILDNSQLYTVILCGRITVIDQTEDYTNFTVDDGTGSIHCRIWQRDNSGITDLTGATLGAYYTVVGSLVKVNNSIILRAVKARKVDNYNTITAHMLTAINEHLLLSQVTTKDRMHWEKEDKKDKAYINSTFNDELDKEAVIFTLSSNKIREDVSGATAEYIFKQCMFEPEKGWKLLEAMLNEGSIYSTTSKHFKLADNN